MKKMEKVKRTIFSFVGIALGSFWSSVSITISSSLYPNWAVQEQETYIISIRTRLAVKNKKKRTCRSEDPPAKRQKQDRALERLRTRPLSYDLFNRTASVNLEGRIIKRTTQKPLNIIRIINTPLQLRARPKIIDPDTQRFFLPVALRILEVRLFLLV